MSLRRDRWPAWALVVLCVAGALPVVRSLLVQDLNWCYPFMTSDSYDWIANGLHLAGAPVESLWRPPGLPIVIGILWKVGVLSLLPVVNYLVLGATTAMLYALLRERFTPAVSAVSAWIFFANDYVQDLTKYVMSEIYGTLFIVLAAWFFLRAARQTRFYLAFGLALGVGFLFQYAALPAGVGFAVSLLLTRRDHLRSSALWRGLAVAAVLAGAWVLLRWWHYHTAAGAPRHEVEALLRFSVDNARLYLVAGLALLGLGLLPVYLVGSVKVVAAEGRDARDFRATVFGPLLSLAIFWLFLYDWTDKRFLYYLFPFCVCLLAEGLTTLFEYANRGSLFRAGAFGYLFIAVLWNQIRYPSYGINYLALTPQDFLEFRAEQAANFKAILHFSGARVVRLHESFPSLSGSLFDYRLGSAPCDLTADSYSCLQKLKVELDSRFVSQPVGLGPVRGMDANFYLNHNRIGNELLRPVIWPENADTVLTSDADPSRYQIFECGAYRLLRRKR